METILLCGILFSMIGLLAGYRMSLQLREDSRNRIAAIYLAEEEMAGVIAEGTHGCLQEQIMKLAGGKKQVFRNQCGYVVSGTAKFQESSAYLVCIKISWKEGGKEKHVELERKVRDKFME